MRQRQLQLFIKTNSIVYFQLVLNQEGTKRFIVKRVQALKYNTNNAYQNNKQNYAEKIVVPEERVELSHPQGRRILNPLRLPFRHSGN